MPMNKNARGFFEGLARLCVNFGCGSIQYREDHNGNDYLVALFKDGSTIRFEIISFLETTTPGVSVNVSEHDCVTFTNFTKEEE